MTRNRFLLRFTHVLGTREPFHDQFIAWAAAVEQRTAGGLEIQVASAPLISEEDVLELIRQGANIGRNSDAARLSRYVPGIAVMHGPYFAETLDDVAKLRRAPTVLAWQDQLADTFGLKVLTFNWVQGCRHFFTRKIVRTPDDMRGLRMRTPPPAIWQEAIRSLGGMPVSVPYGEMFDALREYTIDGVELAYANIPGTRPDQLLTFANETRHLLLFNFQVVSAQWFYSLPLEYQAILVEEAERAGETASRQAEQLAVEAESQLAARGMTINKDVDIAAFRRAGDAAYEALNLVGVKQTIHREIGK